MPAGAKLSSEPAAAHGPILRNPPGAAPEKPRTDIPKAAGRNSRKPPDRRSGSRRVRLPEAPDTPETTFFALPGGREGPVCEKKTYF